MRRVTRCISRNRPSAIRFDDLSNGLGRRLLRRAPRTVQPTTDERSPQARRAGFRPCLARWKSARFGFGDQFKEPAAIPDQDFSKRSVASALARFRMVQPGVRVAIIVGHSKIMCSNTGRSIWRS